MNEESSRSTQLQREAEHHYDLARSISHQLHGHPELGFQEHFASELLRKSLGDGGFEIHESNENLPTAFIATTGSGDLEVGICAEYDALPEVGHACGHNVIAASAFLAGMILKPLLGDLGVSLRIMGTPAEEGGGGKILMLEAGDFTGLNAAMMIHPAPGDSDRMPCVAAKHLNVTYSGKDAHAASFPQLGVNALDAMTIAQVSIGLARQHIYPYDQVHGIITGGGDAPNVIPSHVTGTFILRSITLAKLAEFEPKIMRCFEAGAVATGAKLELFEPSPPYSEFIDDEDLASLYREASQTLGRAVPRAVESLRASTDMANISLELPAIHPLVNIDSLPAVNHQPEFTKAAGSPAADKAIVDGAMSMAMTVVSMATNTTLRNRLLSHRCR